MSEITSFEELTKAPGCKNLQSLLDSYQNVYDKIVKGACNIVLPNLYFSIEKGFDLDRIVSLLTSYLEEKELMNFVGPIPYSLFYLEYSNPQEAGFQSLSALVQLISVDLNRFGHPFGGVLAIDISDWVHKKAIKEEKFQRFLELMKGIDDSTLAVFIDQEKAEGDSLRSFHYLGNCMRIEYYRIELKDPLDGLRILFDDLRHFGLTLNKDTMEALLPVVKKVLELPSNEGPLTLKEMAEDIAYSLYNRKGNLRKTISKEDIDSFLPGGEKYKIYTTASFTSGGLVGD